MGLLFNLLLFPVMGPITGVHWLAQNIAQQVEQEYLDEGKVRVLLSELQARYELAEITEEKYLQKETALLERLKAIREIKGNP